MKRTPEEMIDFYETIFNNDDLCYMVLGALISEEELEDNEKNQQFVFETSKFILENIDKINFKNPELKKTVKTYFEDVPGIIEKYNAS